MEKGVSITATDKKGFTPLHIALENKNEEVVKLFLNAEMPIDISTKPGLSYIQVAVDFCSVEIVDLILKKGGVANLKTGKEFLIHRAVNRGDLKIIISLIEHGADIDSRDEKGLTPLFRAVKQQNARVVLGLLKLGASIKNKECLLHFAVEQYSSVEIVEIFLEFGADVNSKCCHEWNILEKTALQLKDFGIEEVEKKKAEALLRFFLDNRADIHYQSIIGGETILHFAVREQRLKAIEILLEYGVNLNVKDKNGNVPLQMTMMEVRGDGEVFESVRYLHTKPNKYRLVAQILISEIARMQAAKLELDKGNLILMEPYFACYKHEIKEMEVEKIIEGVSYLDLLNATEEKLALYARNQNIIKVLKSRPYVNIFSLYANKIETCLQKGKNRNDLVNSSKQHLRKILDFQFPDLIEVEILSYLSSIDLKALKTVLRSRR